MISPAGHSLDTRKLQISKSRESKLESFLLEWARLDQGYSEALGFLIDMEFSPEEAQEVVMRNMASLNQNQVETFLNVSYSACKSLYVNHGMDIEMGWIGESLHYDKLLYLSSRTTEQVGWESNGVIVNSENSTERAAFETGSQGIFIQAASCGGGFGQYTRGLAIALIEPYSYGHVKFAEGRIVRHDEISGDLRIYCNRVIEVCKRGGDAVYKEIGEEPAQTIREALYDLVGWHPVGWPG